MLPNLPALHSALAPVTTITTADVTIHDEAALRASLIDELILTARFTPDEGLKHACQHTIRRLAHALAIRPSSLFPLYQAIGKGEASGFTVPAFNIRTLSYDVARTLFHTATKRRVGVWVFEIARSEMAYTQQSFADLQIAILAAAIKEGYTGPIFLQADHCQFGSKSYQSDPELELELIQSHVAKALAAEFFNIDIDASTLVDLTRPSPTEQQKDNSLMTARLTSFIRKNQPHAMQVTIGGEIGHIGGKNSTVDDFTAFMEDYLSQISVPGISKVSVQTGTSHGGTPLPDGTLAPVALDFSVLETIGKTAREKYQLAGAVQHGASTLPRELFAQFPKAGTAEIHLSTGLQNLIFQHIPEVLRTEMYAWTSNNCQKERKPEWTDEQFIYKTRKKALGPFAQVLWELSTDEKRPILTALSEEFTHLFTALQVTDTIEKVKRYY